MDWDILSHTVCQSSADKRSPKKIFATWAAVLSISSGTRRSSSRVLMLLLLPNAEGTAVTHMKAKTAVVSKDLKKCIVKIEGIYVFAIALKWRSSTGFRIVSKSILLEVD